MPQEGRAKADDGREGTKRPVQRVLVEPKLHAKVSGGERAKDRQEQIRQAKELNVANGKRWLRKADVATCQAECKVDGRVPRVELQSGGQVIRLKCRSNPRVGDQDDDALDGEEGQQPAPEGSPILLRPGSNPPKQPDERHAHFTQWPHFIIRRRETVAALYHGAWTTSLEHRREMTIETRVPGFAPGFGVIVMLLHKVTSAEAHQALKRPRNRRDRHDSKTTPG
jgi:hypothetical protein